MTLLEPAESPYLSAGGGGDHNVEGLSVVERPLLDEDLYDDVRTVPETKARVIARWLAAEEGLLVGTSTGLNVAAAVEVAAEHDPDGVVTTVAYD